MAQELDSFDFNSRIVSSFFAGFVFWSSLGHLLHSSFLHYAERRIVRRLSDWQRRARIRKLSLGRRSDPEAQLMDRKQNDCTQTSQNDLECASLGDSIFGRCDNPTLVFVLTLLFWVSSLPQFASSLSLSLGLSASQTLCAFLVAWDEMSFQSARLVGLVVLGLNLRCLGVERREAFAFWLALIVITGLVVVTSLLGNGFASPFSNPPTNFCSRRHALAPSLVMSLLAIILELYCIFRIVNIVAPSPLPLQRRAEFLIRDFRVVRAISLLIYDCIIIVPNSIQSTYLADSLPFSFAALVVLAVFNRSTQSPSTWESANLILSEHSLDADAPINISSVEHVKLSRNADNADPGPVVREKVKEIKPVLPSSSCTRYASRWSRPRSRLRTKSPSSQSRGMRSSQYPVQPIIPKAELAQQFNDNEQTSTRPYAHAHALVPRPPVIAEQKRPVSTPIKYPAAAITRTNAKTQRCASIAHSTAQTFSSSVYGSDIIRPEPGRVLRDKMKLPPVDPPPVPIKLTAGVLDATVESPTRTLGFKKDSWLSDLTTEVHHALARALRNETSITSFGENWPLPPTTMPVPGRRKKLV